jgi:hypothetical protein
VTKFGCDGAPLQTLVALSAAAQSKNADTVDGVVRRIARSSRATSSSAPG